MHIRIHIRHSHSLSSAHSLHYECNVQSLSQFSVVLFCFLCFFVLSATRVFFCIAILISAFTLSRFSFCFPVIFNCTVSLSPSPLCLCLSLSQIYTLLEWVLLALSNTRMQFSPFHFSLTKCRQLFFNFPPQLLKNLCSFWSFLLLLLLLFLLGHE